MGIHAGCDRVRPPPFDRGARDHVCSSAWSSTIGLITSAQTPRLKIPFPSGSVGSTPTSGTTLFRAPIGVNRPLEKAAAIVPDGLLTTNLTTNRGESLF